MKHIFPLILLASLVFQSLPASAQKKREVKTIELLCSREKTVAPGAVLKIGVAATQKNRKERRTKGYAGGTGIKALDWEDVIVTVNGGKYLGDDIVEVSKDPRALETQVRITVAMKEDRSLTRTMILPITFRENYFANFGGITGEAGKDGKNRTRILATDGKDGAHGEDGKNGTNGQEIEVFVTSGERDSVNMLKVFILSKTNNTSERYLIDPRGGSITISVDGGNGGKGGDGGNGSNGANARDTTHRKGARPAGDAGNGGNGGKGGNGGNAGKIIFYVDPSATRLFSLIMWSDQSGAAGMGGKAGSAGSAGSGSNMYPAGLEGVNGAPGENGVGGLSQGEPEIIYKKVEVDF